MTNEELNTRLYEKMFAEQEQFRDWLLSQPPAEILNHAYEYTMREDILMSLEYNDLEDSQARALLKSGKPLKQIFERWEDKETSHMENIGIPSRNRPRPPKPNRKPKRRKKGDRTFAIALRGKYSIIKIVTRGDDRWTIATACSRSAFPSSFLKSTATL